MTRLDQKYPMLDQFLGAWMDRNVWSDGELEDPDIEGAEERKAQEYAQLRSSEECRQTVREARELLAQEPFPLDAVVTASNRYHETAPEAREWLLRAIAVIERVAAERERQQP